MFFSQKWRGPQHSTNNQNRYVVCSRSRVRSPLHQCKKAAPTRQTLLELRHPQAPMPVQTDNTMAFGMVVNKIIPKATKAMDMWYHWLWDCKQQQQFWYYWWPGKTIFSDYWTKHHALAHHKHMRQIFLTDQENRTQSQPMGREMAKSIKNRNQQMTWTWHSTASSTEQKMASATVAHLSSCKGVLESQNSLTPTGKGQIGQK